MPKVERVGCMQMILHKLPYPDAACNTSDITVLTFACIQLPCLQVFGCNKLGRFVFEEFKANSHYAAYLLQPSIDCFEL